MTIEKLPLEEVVARRKEFFDGQMPVVINDVVSKWRCYTLWTDDYLRSRCGENIVKVSKARDGIHYYGKERPLKSEDMTLWSYIDLITSDEPDASLYYMAMNPIRTRLPELMDDVDYPPLVAPEAVATPFVWFGPGKNAAPLHYDFMHNYLCQIRGRKRVILYPPSDISNLYPVSFRYPSHHISKVNLTKPDYAAFPRFHKADRLEFYLEQGEMLFLPICWWHAMFGEGINLSVNYWWKPGASTYLRYPRQLARYAGNALASMLG